MKSFFLYIFSISIFAFLLTSCSASKKVSYLQNAETIPADILANSQPISDPILQAGDLLNITVTGPNMTALTPFNKGQYLDEDGRLGKYSMTAVNNATASPESMTEYYLVNADGTIDFPIIGQIKAAGQTKAKLARTIANDIYPRYVTEKPSVDIRLMNFTVTVGGAVRNPGVYHSNNERMTFLEAISLAGDLELLADRENILLYRTEPDGSRSVHRLNLHDKELLLSPYFNLRQNDYIYVDPNKSLKQSAWQMNPVVMSTITVLGGLSSVASLIVGIVNLSK